MSTSRMPESSMNKVLDHMIEQDKDNLIDSVQRLVRIRSVKGDPQPKAPFGKGPSKALEKALEIANQMGFKTINLDGYIGYAEYGSGDEYVAVLGHVDVVPEGDGWTYPPYGANIINGKIYGRGATDDKGPLMAALYGLKAIRDAELPLSKRVRIIIGTNEETDNADIPYYLKKEKAPVAGFTPDAFYPLVYAEKGIINLDLIKDLIHKPLKIKIQRLNGGVASNMVPDRAEAEIESQDIDAIIENVIDFAQKNQYDLVAERLRDSIVVKSTGVAAHGSTPEEGKNAIMQLLSFLGTLSIGTCDIEDAISFLNQSIGLETDGMSLGLALEDKPSGKLSLNLGVIDIKENKLSTALNIRYPVTHNYEDVIWILRQKVGSTVFRIENLRHQKPLYFPLDSPLVSVLLNVFKEKTGFEGKPLAIGGGTYAKEMPNIVAFGPIFPGKPMVEHKPDEYIIIDELVLNCKIYARAIYQLAK
jgi:succinyl-diaminopimelate desuccinylase